MLFTLRTAGPEGLRLRDLNKSVLLHQSALSRLIERMEERGLVRRAKTPKDARGTVVQLTEQGREAQRSVGRIHVEQISHYVGTALSEQELLLLQQLTAKLRAKQDEIPAFAGETKGSK